MATPRIYWYPDPVGTLETTDLLEGISDIQETPGAVVADALNGQGDPSRSFLREDFRVRIIHERFGPVGGGALERACSTLQAHLNHGGFVGFSRDHAKTWCGIAGGSVVRGQAIFYSGGNGFSAWSSAGTVAASDEVVLESANPDALREVNTCSAINSGGDVTLGNSAVYTYGSKAICRWRDFYPVLWLPEDQVGKPIVTHDHRLNYTLDLTLAYSVSRALALWTSVSDPTYAKSWAGGKRDGSYSGGIGLRGTGGPSHGFSLEQRLGGSSGFDASLRSFSSRLRG